MKILRGLLFFFLAVPFAGTARAQNGTEKPVSIEHGQGVTLIADTAFPTPLPFKTTASDGFHTMGAGQQPQPSISTGPFYIGGVLLVKQGDTWDSREVTFIGNLQGVIYRRLYLGDGQIWKQQATAFQIPAENTWWQVWTGSLQGMPDGPVWFEINIEGRSLYTELRNPNISPSMRLGKAFYTGDYIDITGVFVMSPTTPSSMPPAFQVNTLLIGGLRMEGQVGKWDHNNLWVFPNKYYSDGEFPVAVCSFGVCVSDYHGFTMLSDQHQSVPKGSSNPPSQ